MPISALDIRTAKLITTTQIITSVYAVVKELIENALDADTDNIEINLVDNGTSLIEVKDNGCGISKEDAPYMGLPSYTSKISNFADLDILQTFGFRGEALSAICAVAEVIIITKTEKDVVGTSYTMDQSGQIIKYEPCHRSIGTTIQVRNLFKQLPVRRQIITNTRKANQAIRLLETLIQCFGICKSNVRIQFRVNNKLVFTKPSLSNIKEAASCVFGRKIISNMEWIEPKDIEFILQLMLPSKKIQDLSEISHPDLHYIFVNNRPIKHKDLAKLVNSLILEYFKQESYKKKVIFLVYIILEPIDIDVNLEPNKDAILFKDQNKVLDTIDKCIRKFYGLESVEITEQEALNDTSTCYEDDTLNLNQNAVETERPVCKKRKIHAQEKLIEENVINEPTLINSDNAAVNGQIERSQNKQPDNNQIHDQQQSRDVLTLTTHMQPLDLSDSDSNDDFPVTISSKNKMMEEIETFSQLPKVDLGEDFDIEEIIKNDASNVNKDKLNQIQEKKQVSLEAWSKGHVTGLKGGTDIESDIAIKERSDDNLDNKINNKILELDRTHVDHKNLKFLKHLRSQVARENPTFTPAQTAKNITEFWKQLSSEERAYYRNVTQEKEKKHQAYKKAEANKIDSEKNKNRLLQLFEKMKNIKNEKNEKLNIRTIVPWVIDRSKIITRSDSESEHVIGQLTPKLWIATIHEQIQVVDITDLIKDLKVTDIDVDKIDAKRVECLFKQWLLERDDMSVMHSIYKFTKKNKYNAIDEDMLFFK